MNYANISDDFPKFPTILFAKIHKFPAIYFLKIHNSPAILYRSILMARGELSFRIRLVNESCAASKNNPPADRPAGYEEEGLFYRTSLYRALNKC